MKAKLIRKTGEWNKVKLSNHILDLSMYIKGTVDMAQMQITQSKNQQLRLIAQYKLIDMVRVKLHLWFKSLAEWIF
jgi:hypothetical protein